MSHEKTKNGPDPDQQAAIRLRKNGVVAAGAGSGKTTVLAARYLDLVIRDGADVRSILVLTFTRKAAAEMYGRIHRELLESDDPRAREQVDRFSESQISTLDSFCSLILRPEAQDYGYPPDFAVDDAECRRLAETQALAFLLERREEKALKEVFARLGFETAWKDLFADAAARLWTPSGTPDIPAMRKLQRDALQTRSRTLVEALRDADRLAAEEANPSSSSEGKPCAKAVQATAVLGDLCKNLEDLKSEGTVRRLSAVAGLDLKGYGKSDSDARIKEAVKAARECARNLLDTMYMEEQAPLAEAVLGLIAELGERVRKAKRLARVMGFHDVAAAAVDLLQRRTDVREYWKRRFRFVMIDEFQDNNELQKDLLYLLAEREGRSSPGIPGKDDLQPEKLFFVGDEKQSIYRFRGADVSVFRGLSEDLGDGGPSLGTNYRSEPELVAFFNDVFQRVMAGAEKGYEARFSRIASRIATEGVRPSIRYLLKPRRPPAEREGYRSDDEALAYAIASFVRDSVEGRELRVPKPGDGRTAWRYAGYDDFAVLLRTTAKQYLLEKYLRLLAVPYSAGDVCGLFSESPANDIYQALRLAVFPEDGPAYAAFLRSPFVRVSDDAFVRVLASGLPAFDDLAVDRAELSDDDAARFRRGRDILRTLMDEADRQPVSTLVRRLWYRDGLRLSILRKPDAHPFLEHFDYIFRLAADADARGLPLASFVAELEPLAGTPERLADLDAPREAASGLRILTVHKSKGLEFPVVILPFLESVGKSGSNGPAWYLSRKHGITLNLKPWDDPEARRVNVFYDMAREEEADQGKAELKRLFYVACTRASAHLVFAATEPRAADNQCAAFHTLLVGGNGLRDDSGAFPGLPTTVREVPVPDLAETDYLKLFGGKKARDAGDLLPSYGRAASIERRWIRREVSASALNEVWIDVAGRGPGTEEALPGLDYDRAAESVPQDVFGRICHAAVEAELDRDGRGATAFEEALVPVPEALREQIAAEARILAVRFLESPLGDAARDAEELLLEKSFLYLTDGGIFISGRTDLVYRTAKEVVVVDFKSDRRRRPGEYDGQLAAYRAACRALYPGFPVRTLLFWFRSSAVEERFEVHGEAKFLAEAARRAAEPASADETGNGGGSDLAG